MNCPEIIPSVLLASIYLLRSEPKWRSTKEDVGSSIGFTQSAVIRIFVASARVMLSFGRKLVLSEDIISFESASAIYGVYQRFSGASSNGVLSQLIGIFHPVAFITIFKNSARVRASSG